MPVIARWINASANMMMYMMYSKTAEIIHPRPASEATPIITPAPPLAHRQYGMIYRLLTPHI